MLSSATLIASLNDLLNVGKDRTAVRARSVGAAVDSVLNQLTLAQLNDRLLSSKTEEHTRQGGYSCAGSLPILLGGFSETIGVYKPKPVPPAKPRWIAN